MKKTRRKHSPEFKAKAAIEALKGQETLSALSEKFGVSAEMICRWKSELLSNASQAFDSSKASAKKGLKTQALITRHFVGIIRLFLGVAPLRCSYASNVRCKFKKKIIFVRRLKRINLLLKSDSKVYNCKPELKELITN